jgi:iron complex transport system ATP-binding protein
MVAEQDDSIGWFSEVFFEYTAEPALRGVSASIELGKVVAIVGPNGAGKSTLLKILSGERRPKAGEVHLFGKPLIQWNGETIARRRAVLTQEEPGLAHLTVSETVALGRFPHRQEDARFPLAGQEHVNWALKTAGVAHLQDRMLEALSGGERQRVHWARVLAQVGCSCAAGESRLLLLDEPVRHLDPQHQHALLGQARAWKRANDAVVVVLHDLNLALRYADVCWMLQEGRLAAAGPVAEVLQPAAVEEVFNVSARWLQDGCKGGSGWLALYPRDATQARSSTSSSC